MGLLARGLLEAAGPQGARGTVRDMERGEHKPALHGLQRPTLYQNIPRGNAWSAHPSSCLLPTPRAVPGANKHFLIE